MIDTGSSVAKDDRISLSMTGTPMAVKPLGTAPRIEKRGLLRWCMLTSQLIMV
jgi:hypothetical protein